jgi:TRAP-type mannitol/chloroaromatic compound transport system permease large subunit
VLGTIIRAVPFMALQALGLALVLAFPWLASWLPSTM